MHNQKQHRTNKKSSRSEKHVDGRFQPIKNGNLKNGSLVPQSQAMSAAAFIAEHLCEAIGNPPLVVLRRAFTAGWSL